MNVQQRRDPRPRLLAHLRPLDLHPARDPAGDLQAAHLADHRRPALRTARSRASIPTGSTFKPITAIAALESGALTPSDDDRRRRLVHERRDHAPQRRRRRLRRAPAAAGAPGLLRRLLLQRRRRCSTATGNASAQQQVGVRAWASATRPGSTSPARSPGCSRRRQWRNELYKEARARLARWTSVVRAIHRPPVDRGDNVNLAVGQGDLQTNPLQMAVAYAAIANGGDVVRPHVGHRGRGPERARRAGDRPGAAAPPGHQSRATARRSSRGSTWRRSRRAGPPTRSSGTSRSRWPARRGPRSGSGQEDQSWYVALAPVPEPADRGRGDDRAGGVRRPGGGARRASRSSTPTSTSPQAGGQGGRRQAAEAGARSSPAGPTTAAPRVTPTDGLRRLSPPVRRAPRRQGAARARRAPRDWTRCCCSRPLGLIGFSIFTLGAVTGRRHPARPLLLRDQAGDLRGHRHRLDARHRPSRLLSFQGAARRALHGDDRQHHPGAASGPGHARLEAMDRASLLHIPAVGARQGAADRGPRRVRDRSRRAG